MNAKTAPEKVASETPAKVDGTTTANNPANSKTSGTDPASLSNAPVKEDVKIPLEDNEIEEEDQETVSNDTNKEVTSNDIKKPDEKKDSADLKDYKLERPSDSPFNQEMFDKMVSNAKELGLSKEQAQKLMEVNQSTLVEYQKSQQEAYAKQTEGWLDEVKADKELSGEDGSELPKNIQLAKRVLDRFATPKLREQIEKTRLGDYPEFVRLMVRIGKGTAEDSLVTGGQAAGGKKDLAEILYGSKKEVED